MAGFGAFRANGYGRCSVVAGCAVVWVAGDLLGADYNPGDYAVIAGGPRSKFPGSVLSEPRLELLLADLLPVTSRHASLSSVLACSCWGYSAPWRARIGAHIVSGALR